MLANRTQKKCQEAYYSNNCLYDAKLFRFACCNSHGKGKFSLSRYVGPMKKQVKVGSQKEMFLHCCMTDLSRVKEKRW